MKKVLLICGLSACLFSCSLLQRHGESREEEGEIRDIEPGQEAPLFDANGKEIGEGRDTEVSRLNTKVAALETKLEVLTASMERIQAQKSQPIIEAETRPQPTLAAPVDENEEIQDQAHTGQISAAPAKPAPVNMAAPLPTAASGAEKEFRAAMQLFQNNQHLEAASRFALMAKKYPNHLLAGHAVYWAGEASARSQQWDLAIENWSELEKRYPRSAYLPEALAGLAKAYETQGDAAKGKQYRNLLVRSFPKSPIALRAEPASAVAVSASSSIHRASEPAAGEEEPVPVFEGDAETEHTPENQ